MYVEFRFPNELLTDEAFVVADSNPSCRYCC